MSADTSQCCGGTDPAPEVDNDTSPLLWHAGVAAAIALWFVVYSQLPAMSDWLTGLLPVDRHSPTGEAIAFFLYDAPKVILLLAIIVFAMGVINSYFSPEKTRTLLSGKAEGVGNVMSAGLGTPGVVVDEKLVHAGGVPATDKIAGWPRA